MRPARAIIALLVVSFSSLPARAQEAEPDIDPGLFMEALRESYRARAAAERIIVAVSGPSDTIRRSIVLRIEPGAPDDPGPRQARIDLGDLRVWATADRMVCEHAGDPTRYFEAPLPGHVTPGALAEVLPPIPVPQLALATTDLEATSNLFDHARDIRWRSLSRARRGGEEVAILEGDAELGAITLISTFHDLRLRSIRLAAEAGTLELTIREIEGGSPETWPIATEGRVRIDTLRALRTAPGPIPIGAPLPDLRVRTRLGEESIPLDGLLGDAPTCLIVHRVPVDAGIAEAIEQDARAALSACRATAGARPVILSAVELAAGTPERVGTLLERWREWGGEAPIAWHDSPALTIGRLAPGRDACIAVIDGGRRLVGIISLDGRAADDAAIAQELGVLLAAPGGG